MILTSLSRLADVRNRARLGAPLVALSMALAVGACGSSAKPRASRTSNTQTAHTIAFSKCMRAHGVTHFPDPGGPVPNGPYNSFAGIVIPPSLNLRSPAVKAAKRSCQGLLTSVLSSQGKPPITAAQKASLIKNAQCLRKHGVPNYPDPTFPAGGGIAIQAGTGFNPDSEAFKRAQSACGAR